MKRINQYEGSGLQYLKQQSVPRFVLFNLGIFAESLLVSQRSLSLRQQYAIYQEQQAIEPRNTQEGGATQFSIMKKVGG